MDATFANPYAGMDDIQVDGSIYLDPLGPYHDYVISVMFPVLYFILCVILFIKTRGGSQALTKLQKQFIVQSIILSAFIVAACYLFLYMQFFYVPQFFSILSHVIWQSSHGASVFTYMINKSMRKEVMVMLRQIKGEKVVIVNQVNPISIHVKPTWLRASTQ
uniref:Uncharacterized protein n=1 Tax=Acrobeloides nanus TaxID=290746 RepID=A0A914CGJ9_9BILA